MSSKSNPTIYILHRTRLLALGLETLLRKLDITHPIEQCSVNTNLEASFNKEKDLLLVEDIVLNERREFRNLNHAIIVNGKTNLKSLEIDAHASEHELRNQLEVI